ncbi:hypothetical protein PRUPE_1G170900 [Prunus persica]|uniref:No apical meristem-associated C-terminal domain-containing protein n=1 Tax=Prunus persica TaxID=3760 RepID=A0A251R1N0_PRUPE|nr:hypothetical protein PRUPE_1G170900 [Prunus persica]
MRLEDLKLNLNSLNNRNHNVSAKPNPRSFKRPSSSDYDYDSNSHPHPVRVLSQQTKRRVKRLRQMPKAKDIDEEDNGGLAPLKAVFNHGVSEVSSSNFSSCKSPVTVLHHASPVNATTSDEINLSPRRAARVAMLKARFAGTIFKAKQEVLYSGSNGLENTEDEIRKFRAAEMMKANEYIKEQRQRDREAARLALEEMERNVVIDDNFKTMRDFEMLISGANC